MGIREPRGKVETLPQLWCLMHLFSVQVEMSSKHLGLGPGAVGYMRARDGGVGHGNRDGI